MANLGETGGGVNKNGASLSWHHDVYKYPF